MEIDGTIQNGVVVLEADTQLPDGTPVKVTVPDSVEPKKPTHYDVFREVIGQAQDLPEDFAKNHNHYIRGGRKQ